MANADAIDNLDDRSAVALLTRVTRSRPREARGSTPSPSELRQVLLQHFAPPSTTDSTLVSDGDLARQALRLMSAEDSVVRDSVQSIMDDLPRQPSTFEPVTVVALTTAVLVALQTQFHFERDKNGKWLIEIKKKPTSEALLKGLIQKLLAYLPQK